MSVRGAVARILCIDDEPLNHELVRRALEPLGCRLDFAEDGTSGISMARALKPDLIITDVMMPGINGYEVTRLLRRESDFAVTPILILTVQSGLQDKLKAFESGADDFLSKPFEGPELAARVTALLRRLDAARAARPEVPAEEEATMIVVHSLRGGTGCSTLAVNLSVGLASLWPNSTILVDLVMTAGQVALMLNAPLRRTWADLARFEPGALDQDLLMSVTNRHDSGLAFIPAATFPTESQLMSGELLASALSMLKRQYEYVVADLPHDFSDVAVRALDLADLVLMVATPDMASVRAVIAARDTYVKLGYPEQKIKLILNATFPRLGLPRDKIESALSMSAFATIPYVQDTFIEALNYGRPPVYHKPLEPISALLEDLAFFLSKDARKKTKPELPTEAWLRVYKRYQSRKK
jgi:pilus assembly protein CpaE